MKHWYSRPFWLGVALLTAVLIGRLALTPAVDDATRIALRQLPNLRATYSDISLFSFPPSIVLTDFVATDLDDQRVLHVPRLEIHLSWDDVWRGVAAGAWPYPAPHVRLRAVKPALALRSAEPREIAMQVREMLDGLPALHVDVVSIEEARVTVLAQGTRPAQDCVTNFTTAFQKVDLGAAAEPSPLGEEPPRVPAVTRGQVKVPELCRRLVTPPSNTVAAPAGRVITSSLDTPDLVAR